MFGLFRIRLFLNELFVVFLMLLGGEGVGVYLGFCLWLRIELSFFVLLVEKNVGLNFNLFFKFFFVFSLFFFML